MIYPTVASFGTRLCARMVLLHHKSHFNICLYSSFGMICDITSRKRWVQPFKHQLYWTRLYKIHSSAL